MVLNGVCSFIMNIVHASVRFRPLVTLTDRVWARSVSLNVSELFSLSNLPFL
jgi:hypothetical protein